MSVLGGNIKRDRPPQLVIWFVMKALLVLKPVDIAQYASNFFK